MKTIAFLVVLFTVPAMNAQETATAFAPTLESTIVEDQNLIYCTTTELLWRELIEYMGGIPKFILPNENTMALRKSMNDYSDRISEDHWLAIVGETEDGIIDSITREMNRKFKNAALLDLPNENDIIGYSYLEKNVKFSAYLTRDVGAINFKGTLVKAFGLEGGFPNKYNERVKIHDYQNKDDFILQLECKDSLDQIYLAKISPGATLSETYEKAISRVEKDSIRYLKKYDMLKIPFLQFDITENFIDSLPFVIEETTTDYHFVDLTQRIKFDLNEEGIKLHSNAAAIIDFGEFEPATFYTFDQPFLVIMKRKGRQEPYFVYWVANAEHMKTWR
ncbi:MAG: hypothetical protein ACFHU9_15045 [Fluviicola sp.]